MVIDAISTTATAANCDEMGDRRPPCEEKQKVTAAMTTAMPVGNVGIQVLCNAQELATNGSWP